MEITLLGIRHHGVGSARQILAQLEKIKPDLVLIEGPPDISFVLNFVGDKALKPPVAVMVYDAEQPKNSVFYPFSSFSPEWVAAKYANQHKIPVKALDMPAAYHLSQSQTSESELPDSSEEIISEEAYELPQQNQDVMSQLAVLSGFNNSEQWWEYYFERKSETLDSESHFKAVMLTMETLRETQDDFDKKNPLREAYMRTILREAQQEMYSNIVVVCGAWHAPALKDLKTTEKGDKELIKNTPKSKTKIVSTWIPWTNERLAFVSGYGAGITSPGWYQHLWDSKSDYAINWLVKVANIFRKKEIDISSAHIIEAMRLAESLAAIRNKSQPTLDELNEATLAVMCMGDKILLEFIKKELIIANKIGHVPENIPKVPIQEDFEKQIKALRIPLTSDSKSYEFDLRKENDLKRSILLHRLELIGIQWGKRTYSRTKGTFKEAWELVWTPELMISLIDKSFLGNTIESAASAVVLEKSSNTTFIHVLTELIHQLIPAELFEGVPIILDKIHQLSAISADMVDLMKAIYPLVDISRYGNVRKTDTSVVGTVIHNLLAKIFIGMPNACYGLNEQHSEEMFALINKVNDAVRLLENKDYSDSWCQTLNQALEKDGVNSLIKGRLCRLLMDANFFTEEEVYNHISLALSSSNPPYEVAQWIEGFLGNSGTILLYDSRIWNLLYQWVDDLSETVFYEQLPFLRRAFSKFEYGERRQIGEKAKKGISEVETTLREVSTSEFDEQRGEKVFPVMRILMGVS